MQRGQVRDRGPSVRLGPLRVTGWDLTVAVPQRALDDPDVPRGDSIAVHLLPAGETITGATRVVHEAGDLLLADPADPLVVAGPPGHGMTLRGPRRAFVALPATALPLCTAGSGVPDALWRLLDELLAAGADHLSDAQAGFAGTAALHLVAAALAGDAAPNAAARRTASLLARASDYIDRHIAEPIDAGRLSAALGCSRATLYRAVAPAGGVAELLSRRRLAAAHTLIGDPDDGRSIGEIARAHGFEDAARFNRLFKKRFGVTPGARRRAAGTGTAAAR